MCDTELYIHLNKSLINVANKLALSAKIMLI